MMKRKRTKQVFCLPLTDQHWTNMSEILSWTFLSRSKTIARHIAQHADWS